MELKNKISNIESKTDFVSFVEFLAEDFKKNPDAWENKKLSDYLEALARWTEDMEGYYKNNNIAVPSDINWKVFAEILTAAKMYE